jgi:hypothetical protein
VIKARTVQTGKGEYSVRFEVSALVLEVQTLARRADRRALSLDWEEVAYIPPDASWRALLAARRGLLEDPRFFVTCGRCGKHEIRNYHLRDRCPCTK